MLSVLFNVGEGGICMRFDDAGREEVLLSLKLAIKERDHDFFLPDICEEAEGDLAEEWKPRDFVNIICHPDDNAPLRVEDGVEIIGGIIALTSLAERLRSSIGSLTIG